jgi:hypothetical protein
VWNLLRPPDWLVYVACDLANTVLGSLSLSLVLGKPVGVWYWGEWVWYTDRWLTGPDKDVVDDLFEAVQAGRPLSLMTSERVRGAAVRIGLAVVMGVSLLVVLVRSCGGPEPARSR